MATPLSRAQALVADIRGAIHSDASRAKALLTQFKLAMTEFPSQVAGTQPSPEECVVARTCFHRSALVRAAS